MWLDRSDPLKNIFQLARRNLHGRFVASLPTRKCSLSCQNGVFGGAALPSWLVLYFFYFYLSTSTRTGSLRFCEFVATGHCNREL